MIIDVSENNGKINWDQVSLNQPRLEGVMVKMNEGYGFPDKRAEENIRGAERIGLKWGPYHFATLNSKDVVSDATQEANYFADSLRNLPKPTLPLALDIETNKLGLQPSQVLSWILTFFKVLETRGYPDYVLYSYTPFLNTNLPTNHPLGKVRLWIAAYVNTPTPKLPVGWQREWLWQYSSKGRVTGIVGNVDINKFPTNQ